MWRSVRAWCTGIAVGVLVACAPVLSQRARQHQAWLIQGERAQAQGNLQGAALAYQRAASSAPTPLDREESLYRASRLRARLGDYAGAVEICDEIAAYRPPGARALRAQLDGARYRMRLGAHGRAERDLRSLVLQHGDTGEAKSALYLLIERQVRTTGLDRTLSTLRELETAGARGFVAEALRYEEARLLSDAGRTAEARAVLLAQIERFPYPEGVLWEDALWRLADLTEEAEPRAALGYLTTMVEAHERSLFVGSYTRARFPSASLRIARLYRDRLGDPQAAVRAFRTTRERFPESRVADDALGDEAALWLSLGDSDRACALYRELRTRYPVGAARRRAIKTLEGGCGGGRTGTLSRLKEGT